MISILYKYNKFINNKQMRKYLLAMCTLLFSITYLKAQADGNPHKWDRIRRCDNQDYEVECGICEGVGGIAWGDKNDQIALTKCEPVANATDIDISTLALPYFPNEFTNTGFYEVLIGKKKNLACIGSFPGPDSIGDLCYTKQEGTFHYDWNNYRLRFDYVQPGFVNTYLTTYHTKGDMWIVPDYRVIQQCICVDAGRSFNGTLYPVNPKFMEKDSRYIGREQLFIEYLEVVRLVDHWVKGPHHVWVDVASGHIIRMWQPFNGLEVFDPTKWEMKTNPDVFDAPPKACKKQGGAWIRIGCMDDGNIAK